MLTIKRFQEEFYVNSYLQQHLEPEDLGSDLWDFYRHAQNVYIVLDLYNTLREKELQRSIENDEIHSKLIAQHDLSITSFRNSLRYVFPFPEQTYHTAENLIHEVMAPLNLSQRYYHHPALAVLFRRTFRASTLFFYPDGEDKEAEPPEPPEPPLERIHP